jgi:hypothetical protein
MKNFYIQWNQSQGKWVTSGEHHMGDNLVKYPGGFALTVNELLGSIFVIDLACCLDDKSITDFWCEE